MSGVLDDYPALLRDIKARIQGAQVRAALAANRELLLLYWDIGRLIAARQAREGWGTGVIPRLAQDLASELPGAQGFSERNLRYMVRFAREYSELAATTLQRPTAADQGAEIRQQPVAESRGLDNGQQSVADLSRQTGGELERLVLAVPWGHNILILQKIASPEARLWYLEQCVAQGWSRDVLAGMIRSDAHARQGGAITNFATLLPTPQSDLAQQTLKDPYIFDFLTLQTPFRERELEAHLLAHLERFLLELGVGFAFVGRQHRLTLDDEDFYLDLLFYHLKLRCFVVVDLKVGPFQAEHAGKMNLYLNLVDDLLRHPDDQPSIGLILCQDKKRLLAEYALRGLDKPIGVSEYELTRSLPKELASALPTIDAIEAELTRDREKGESE
jgi:predicted nuclease of restriction endonuclease-like (RecB) superfamily